jgi:hypothetical protein
MVRPKNHDVVPDAQEVADHLGLSDSHSVNQPCLTLLAATDRDLLSRSSTRISCVLPTPLLRAASMAADPEGVRFSV